MLIAAIAIVLAFLLPSSSHAANTQLCATVSSDFTITLKDASCGGPNVAQLDPGTYDIVVHDNSTIHNFHLSGPGGVDMATTIPETTAQGGVTWTLTLVGGSYKFQCDAHPLSMKG